MSRVAASLQLGVGCAHSQRQDPRDGRSAPRVFVRRTPTRHNDNHSSFVLPGSNKRARQESRSFAMAFAF